MAAAQQSHAPWLFSLPTPTLGRHGRRSLWLLEWLLGLEIRRPASASTPSLPAAGGRASPPPLLAASRALALRARRGGLHHHEWMLLPCGHASCDRTTYCSLPNVWRSSGAAAELPAARAPVMPLCGQAELPVAREQGRGGPRLLSLLCGRWLLSSGVGLISSNGGLSAGPPAPLMVAPFSSAAITAN
jgi:hypothetical protein